MSLSGNLGFVSLDEILRLLTRSEQQGSVDVSGAEVRGRIFVTKGGIALATTFDESSLRQHLIRSGLVDELYMKTVESGEATLDSIAEQTNGGLTAFLREITVESLYQLGIKGTGFDVTEGATTTFASPDAFELESVLDDSRQRLNEWAEVSRTISDLSARLQFKTDLGDREDISIDRDGWRVISHVGSGSSVSALADRLGTTEFWTASVAARLVNMSLVEFAPEPAGEETTERDDAWSDAATTDPNESWWQEPAEEEPESEQPADEVEEHEEAVAEAEESHSFFGEYADRVEGVFEDEDDEIEDDEAEEELSTEPEEVTEDSDDSLIPALSEVEASDSAEVEEDTEAFLEKVFSELESTEEQAPAEEEGYGLLRRRRMGAIRDAAGES